MARLALGAWPILPAAGASKKISSKIRGVAIGLAAYSLSTLPRQGILDTIVRTMVEFGIGDCEMWWPLIEPAELEDRARPARGGGGAARAGSGGGRAPVSPEQTAAMEELRKWHATVSLDYFKDIRKKFADAGIEISSMETSPGASPTDEELVRDCQITKALGAGYLMINSPRSVAKRLAPIAEKQGVKIGLEGRPNMKSTDPNAISKPQDFEEALSYSKNFGLSIDVGDATGGGYDALKFVQDHHSRLFAMNVKDRTKAGASVPWGEGDSKIKEILQWVRDKKYPIRCYIDCDVPTVAGGSRVADVKRCLDFAKTVLASS
jgi:sugar phosphate isomerase/epimerase